MENVSIEYLVLKAAELFKRYGIKSFTMDDLASELGMSKKTIYRLVSNKSELVKLVIQDYLRAEKKTIETIVAQSDNAVEEMTRIATYFTDQMRDFNAYALHDMKKYYPESWDIYVQYKFGFVLKRLSENIKKGKEQGLYRKDLDGELISKVYIGSIDVLLSPGFFPTRNNAFAKLYKEYLNYHLHGIVSPRGMKVLEQQELFKK